MVLGLTQTSMIFLAILIICSATALANPDTCTHTTGEVVVNDNFPFGNPDPDGLVDGIPNDILDGGCYVHYKEQIQTRMLTNEDLIQSRLLKQISKYLLENYSKYVPGQHILSLADLDADGYGSKKPVNRFDRTTSDNLDGDFVVIAPGCYEIPLNLFGRRMLKVEVTQSEPVGLESSLSIYRTFTMTGYERDLDLLIFRARREAEPEDNASIRVYQSTYWGDWDSGT